MNDTLRYLILSNNCIHYNNMYIIYIVYIVEVKER